MIKILNIDDKVDENGLNETERRLIESNNLQATGRLDEFRCRKEPGSQSTAYAQGNGQDSPAANDQNFFPPAANETKTSHPRASEHRITRLPRHAIRSIFLFSFVFACLCIVVPILTVYAFQER